MISLEWDESNRRHIAEHDVSTLEVEEVLQNDPVDLEMQVVDGELRFTLIGETARGRILLVVLTERGERLRPVTAYRPVAHLRTRYLRERGARY